MTYTEYEDGPFYRLCSESALRFENVKKFSSSKGRVIPLRNVGLGSDQQQKVAITRASINDFKITLAHEATMNSDTKTRQGVFNQLDLLAHKFKRAIIIVTYNNELLAATNSAIK